ncbi:hypothetical protein AaE_014705, partial [Aphanomyces astaci]
MAAHRAQKWATESADDRRQRLSTQSAMQAAIRSKESPEEHAIRLEKLKAKRAMESTEEHASRLMKLKAHRGRESTEEHVRRLENLKARRDMESPEDHSRRLQNLKIKRDMESPDERARRLQILQSQRDVEDPQKHAMRLQRLKANRAMQTPEEHASRLQDLKAKRCMESPEQHRARLDSLKAQRSVETPDKRASRLSKLQGKRQLELPEDRGIRLNALKAQYSAQTAEARSNRLGYLKAQRKALHVSESVEERERRLERRRQGLHRVQEAKSNNVTASEAQCAALDDAGLLHECSEDIKSKILGELGFALGPSGMDQCVCCVCDRLAFTTDVHVYSTEDKDVLQSMAARLRIPDVTLYDELVAFYDCKDIHPAFIGLMLSRKGIKHDGNVNDIENPRDVDFNVCLECETVLLQPWLSELP